MRGYTPARKVRGCLCSFMRPQSFITRRTVHNVAAVAVVIPFTISARYALAPITVIFANLGAISRAVG